MQVARRLRGRLARGAARIRHLRRATGEISAQLQAQASEAERHRAEAQANALMALDYAIRIGG
jgi:hypothetical protein